VSHPPHPQQPAWSQPQQPGWGTPPPPPPQRPPLPPKKNTGRNIGFGCVGVIAVFVLISIISAATSGSNDGKGKSDTAKDAPAYNVVEKDTSGNTRQVVVEVDSTKDLEAVFNDVADTLTDKAGYWVQINCSTGGTDKVDNRLGNGKKAVGNVGAAATGLKDGQTEFSANKDRTCPVSPADEAKQNADQDAAAKAAGIPPEPTGAKRAELLDALGAVNPDIVKYEDKAIGAARNQCSAINGGAQRLDWSASQRFTYKDVTTTEAQGKQINDRLKSIGFCKV
jgi:hypothetical protein